MWKYMNKTKTNHFLLSLNLIDNKLIDSEKIRKIYTITNHIEDNYKVYKIKKQSSGYRTIHEPNYELKYIQKQILHNILDNIPISKYAKAYHKEISLKENGGNYVTTNR